MNFHRYEKKDLSIVLKFATIQNKLKRAEMKYARHTQRQPLVTNCLLTMSTTRQVLESLLMTEESLFTWVYRKWFSLSGS